MSVCHTNKLIKIYQLCWLFGAVLLFLHGCGSLLHHRVERGDTLYSIGFYYGHDYRDIAKWNNIPPPYVINEGQWLIVTPPQDPAVAVDGRRQRISQRGENKNKKSSSNNNSIKRPVIRQSTAANSTSIEPTASVSRWQWPTEGKVRNSDKSLSARKKGINIIGTHGQPIYATAAGKVVYSGNGLIGFGNLIIIKHNKTYLSAYGHNEHILVKEGDMVKQGQQIAQMGRAQDNLAQLHFEIRRNGKPVDPLHLLASRSQ